VCKKKNDFMHNLFLVYFVNLYMVGLELQSNQDNRQSSKKDNKYQLLYTYGYNSWWWA